MGLLREMHHGRRKKIRVIRGKVERDLALEPRVSSGSPPGVQLFYGPVIAFYEPRRGG
jgi:hypothetical protein